MLKKGGSSVSAPAVGKVRSADVARHAAVGEEDRRIDVGVGTPPSVLLARLRRRVDAARFGHVEVGRLLVVRHQHAAVVRIQPAQVAVRAATLVLPQHTQKRIDFFLKKGHQFSVRVPHGSVIDQQVPRPESQEEGNRLSPPCCSSSSFQRLD